MKKLAFLFVAMVAVSFASCGNKSNSDAAKDEARITDSIAQVEEAAAAAKAAAEMDTIVVDSAATETVAE